MKLTNKYINPIWANVPPKSNVPRIPATHLIICAPNHRNPQTSAEH